MELVKFRCSSLTTNPPEPASVHPPSENTAEAIAVCSAAAADLAANGWRFARWVESVVVIRTTIGGGTNATCPPSRVRRFRRRGTGGFHSDACQTKLERRIWQALSILRAVGTLMYVLWGFVH
jgi:hypothetical protein